MSNGERNALRNGNVRSGLSRARGAARLARELVAWWWAGLSEHRMRTFVHRACAHRGHIAHTLRETET